MSEKIFEKFEKKLEELKKSLLHRSVKDVEEKNLMRVSIEGKEYINFASNDYLGLNQNPLVKESAIEAIKLFGTGAGASRVLCGGTIFHKKVEELLCRLKNTETALVLNSGYSLNTSLIPAITEQDDVIFSDELNHASIIDGCRLTKAKKVIYKHVDIENLSQLLKQTDCKGKRIVITDTVFSMDGDIAPLKELYELCKAEEALLYLDDAHGTGVLGEGSGALKQFGLPSDKFIIQMGTLSKALGSFGGFVCGTDLFIDWFINNARGFIFSTALPPSVVASSYASLKLIMEDKRLINKLWQNTEKVIAEVKSLGLPTTETKTPIIPVLFKNIEDAIKASKIFTDFGIYAPVIRPPTVKIPRIRVSITAAHTEEDIERLKEAFNHLCQQLHQV